MPAKNENYYIALSQILLVDPASETPRIHTKRKDISKRQMIRRLELMVKEFEELEIEIDVSPYQDTIDLLKKSGMIMNITISFKKLLTLMIQTLE